MLAGVPQRQAKAPHPDRGGSGCSVAACVPCDEPGRAADVHQQSVSGDGPSFLAGHSAEDTHLARNSSRACLGAALHGLT